MNIAIKKLMLIEKMIEAKEEEAKINGYVSTPAEMEFKTKISDLINKIQLAY
ncbi:hypothetical protein IJO12_02960 [bacterium]|nr:hypothetical protein [bacterium]